MIRNWSGSYWLCSSVRCGIDLLTGTTPGRPELDDVRGPGIDPGLITLDPLGNGDSRGGISNLESLADLGLRRACPGKGR